MNRQRFDVLVVGAGPAGLAAASSAAASGVTVGLIDDNPLPGGQIWRATQGKASAEAAQWLAHLQQPNVTLLPRTRIIAAPVSGQLLAENPTSSSVLEYKRLILATGARELFLPFSGWTLPGVMGAGGLQALVKGGLPIAGKRVVVAGSGPLLLAVASYLKKKGANVLLIAEQTPWRKMVPFGMGLAREWAKMGQGAGFAWALRGTPLLAGSWVTSAEGSDKLEAVTLRVGSGTRRIECDYLACGFGLVPNLELPQALGCTVRNGVVPVDRWQQSSVPGVYCAGELTGIGGVDLSVVEGRIAGFAASGRRDLAEALFVTRTRAKRFALTLNRAFALRPELKQLADPDTIVCRCEDVEYERLQQNSNWRSAKLQTRCGMGPCQGRVCGAATSFLFGWELESVRPPLATARVASLAAID